MEIYGMTGERLGTIGQPLQIPADKSLPKWKQDLSSKPSISVRKGIAWGYSAPYEDTSTLVLTATSSAFIDIRFPLRTDANQPLTTNPSFWAFSGVSSITFDPETSNAPMLFSAHSVWKHDIDSKGAGITDEGDLFLLQNGDVMEVGMMPNPSTSKIEMYKEYWTEPDTEPGLSTLQKTPCVVATTEDDSKNRGVVIRIGGYCQGIFQPAEAAEGDVLVERWLRTAPTEHTFVEAKSSNWLRDSRSNTNDGTPQLPCMWACDGERCQGDEIVIQGVRWRITEVLK